MLVRPLGSLAFSSSVVTLARTMATRPTVLVTRPDLPKAALQKLAQHCEVDVYEKSGPMPPQDLEVRVSGKSGLLCMLTDRVGEKVLSAGDGLRVVSTLSVGYDHLDMKTIKEKGIKVGYTPDVLTDASAELTVALLLATSRRLFAANREITSGGWASTVWGPGFMVGKGLAGATVGVFGMGRIGKAVVQRLAGFGVAKFIYSATKEKPQDPALPPTHFVSFDELCEQSDFVVVTASLSPATREMFNLAAFRKMKDSAVFINTSRGALVNQDDLVTALKEKLIWGAGLDVMTPEPLPSNHELTTLPNCTLLPHIGSAEEVTRAQMADLAVENLICGLENRPMPCQV